MKKLYSTLVFLFLFGCLFGFSSYGQINANVDNGTAFNSNSTQIVIQNVLNNDTLNGIPVTLSDVTITQISATSSNVSVQPNGTAVVNAGTPNGTYTVTYQICSIANPNSCDTANVYLYIVSPPPPPIHAVNDAVTISNGLIAPQIVLENILTNDTLNNIPVTLSDVTISQTTPTTFNIDSSGNVGLLSGPYQTGTYYLPYTICQTSNPNNCSSAYVLITVVNSLSTTIMGTYQDLNGDGVTDVGDVINYTFSITNHSTSTITNIAITSNEVNINGGPPITLNSNATNSTTFTGIHVLTQEDINHGQALITIQTNGTLNGNAISVSAVNATNLNISDGIRLNAFRDYNGNGIQDPGEPNFSLGEFQYELNGNGITHHIISPTGIDYLYETNPANVYLLSYVLDPAYASQYILANPSYSNVTVANGSGIITYNFPVTVAPYTDLAVYLYGGIPPRPGFIYYNTIYYTNYGNQTIASGTVSFTNSNVVTITSVTPTATTTNANGFTYNFTNLLPGETRYIYVAMQVPTIPTVQLGDLVINAANITIPSGDIHPYNNVSNLIQVIVGSYDPNEKTESHGGKIVQSTFTANDYLTYTIRFENTGTANAINIKVQDVLNAKLDETSVKMITASHSYILDRVGNTLTWKFNGINLPHSVSTSTTIGHGYIVFQVKPKAGYTIGDIIPNTANIYFDFNPAIVTNNCTTEFVNSLNTDSFAFENFTYYPNPVKNSLYLSNASTIDTVEITSILGQKVMIQKVNDLQTEMNLSGLQTGIYFVKVSSQGQEKTVKIIKD